MGLSLDKRHKSGGSKDGSLDVELHRNHRRWRVEYSSERKTVHPFAFLKALRVNFRWMRQDGAAGYHTLKLHDSAASTTFASRAGQKFSDRARAESESLQKAELTIRATNSSGRDFFYQ